MNPRCFLSAAVLVATFSVCPAETETEKWADDQIRKMDAVGITALVARDGKILWQGAGGFADVEKKAPVTLTTKFRIGSVSKQFTAAAVLKLAQEGKLALSDPLSKFFPDFPNGEKITVHQLINHTSGIRSYTGKPGFMDRVEKPVSPAELIEWFRDDKPDFAPGAGFAYNNSGYFLAGEIVAKVYGSSLEEYLRTAFFDPLGMKDTGVYVNARPPTHMASGFSWSAGKLEPALDWDMSWAGGAGALYSTIGDLMKWNDALHGGRVLHVESLKSMVTPNELPPGADGMNYGYGLIVEDFRGVPLLGHSGGLNGWASSLLYFPDQKCTVVVLANAQPLPPGVNSSEFSRALAVRFLNGEVGKEQAFALDKSVDPKTYAEFAGRYNYKGAIMTVSTKNDRLYAQLTDQKKFEIFPKAQNVFFWKDVDAEVAFVRDGKGQVVAARHTQYGITFTAGRLANAAITLSIEQLDAILGQYQYGPKSVMSVTREGDQLFAQLTGQKKYAIHPKSAEEFEWRVVAASVRFVAGPDGKIVKAVHAQNGATFDAPKVK